MQKNIFTPLNTFKWNDSKKILHSSIDGKDFKLSYKINEKYDFSIKVDIIGDCTTYESKFTKNRLSSYIPENRLNQMDMWLEKKFRRGDISVIRFQTCLMLMMKIDSDFFPEPVIEEFMLQLKENSKNDCNSTEFKEKEKRKNQENKPVENDSIKIFLAEKKSMDYYKSKISGYQLNCIQHFNNNSFIQSSSFANHIIQDTQKIKKQYQLDIFENKVIDFLEEMNEYYKNAVFYENRCRAFIYIEQGNKLFDQAINSSEGIIMDLIYDSLDKYREALQIGILNSCNNISDIELEAICCAKIAIICFDILKKKEKSYELATHVVKLALSMHPKNVETTSWYRKINNIVIQKQKEIVEEEERKKEKIKKEHKEEYEKQHKLIKTKFNELSRIDFIKFIFKDFPPENEKYKAINVDEEFKSNQRKGYAKLSGFYHPDKYSDPLKKIIYEEIQKYINSVLDELKC